MADIIQMRRGNPPAPSTETALADPPVHEPWLLPWAMFRMGVAVWASLWFAPLGLRVERSEADRPDR